MNISMFYFFFVFFPQDLNHPANILLGEQCYGQVLPLPWLCDGYCQRPYLSLDYSPCVKVTKVVWREEAEVRLPSVLVRLWRRYHKPPLPSIFLISLSQEGWTETTGCYKHFVWQSAFHRDLASLIHFKHSYQASMQVRVEEEDHAFIHNKQLVYLHQDSKQTLVSGHI